MNETERRTGCLLAMLPERAVRRLARRRGAGRGAKRPGSVRPRRWRFSRATAPPWSKAFSRWADREMLARIGGAEFDQLKVRERVASAVRARLGLLAPYREAARRGLAMLALPQNAPLAVRLLYDTVDAIWYAAGDAATDFNFYSKRALLGGVYAATMLYWLDDRSPDERRRAAARAPARRRHEPAEDRRAAARDRWDRLPNPLRFLRAAQRR